MAIDFDSNLPIYIQVMDYIKKEIVSGRFKTWRSGRFRAGFSSAIWRQSQYCAAFSVELEREGLLKSERTAGRFISENEELIGMVHEQMATSCISRYVKRWKIWGLRAKKFLLRQLIM